LPHLCAANFAEKNIKVLVFVGFWSKFRSGEFSGWSLNTNLLLLEQGATLDSHVVHIIFYRRIQIHCSRSVLVMEVTSTSSYPLKQPTGTLHRHTPERLPGKSKVLLLRQEKSTNRELSLRKIYFLSYLNINIFIKNHCCKYNVYFCCTKYYRDVN
jgi:hypothetical protein